MTRRAGFLALSFSNIAHFYTHLFVLLYATVVLVLEREWGLGYDTLFALSIPMTVMFGAGALPAGWLADRWSPVGMITVFFFGLGAGAIITGLAESTVMIAVGLTIMGTFAAIYHPVGIPWLVRHARNHGRALGMNGVFGSMGTAAAALIAGGLATWLGWRAAFILPGAVAIATGFWFLWLVRAGLVIDGTEDVKPAAPVAKADTRRVFLVLTATMMCTGLIFQTTAFALPKIFEQRLTDDLASSLFGIGGMVSVVFAAGALAQIVGGELADRYRLKTVYMFGQFAQIPVLLLAFTLHSPALVLAAALMVSLNVGGQPAENALVARYAPPGWRSRAFGAKFVISLGISSAGVALIPIIYRFTGSLDVLFVLLAGLALCAGLAATRLPGRAGEPAVAPAE